MGDRSGPSDEPMDPWALADEASRLGVSLAGRIASEFARLVPGAGDRTAPDVTGTPESEDLTRSLRAAHVEIERSVDGFLTLLADAVDGAAEALTRQLSSGGDAEGGLETVEVRVAADDRVVTELWIHNTTTSASEPLRLHHTALVRHDGVALVADVSFDPASIPVEAHDGRPVSMTVAPDAASDAGRYHGLVMVSGVTDALVHLVVEVSTTVGDGAASA